TAGKLKGDEISFIAAGVEYTGKVDGDMIAGTTGSGETWQAKRDARAVTAQVPASQPAEPKVSVPQSPGLETSAPPVAEPSAPKTSAAAEAKSEQAPFVPEVSQ